MAEHSGLDEPRVRQPRPRAILDGGGEPWTTLAATVGRLIAELAPGAVLEVISREPSTRDALPAWCIDAGHEVFWLLEGAQLTRFWITKGGTLRADHPVMPR